ncbi:MAG TPA: UDP-N-acetylmuramoyl-L-alanine--D-glutamate ligase [Devosiaceae bacterium]
MPLDRPILLYGAGREARSTRAFFAAHAPEAPVFVTVDSGEVDLEDVATLDLGEAEEMVRDRYFALIVKSPGVSRYKPFFETAAQARVPVTSNLNLWGEFFRKGRTVIAITGTKGKSTTATLVHLMLTESGIEAALAGNVGVPPLDVGGDHDLVVFELSSYQTADIGFAPDLAGITNLSPEHVDWHGSVEKYYEDKLNLIRRPGDFQVALGRQAISNPRVLSAISEPGKLMLPLAPDIAREIVRHAPHSRLKGEHNLDNALLAAQLAHAAGASLDGILRGIEMFKPLPHRLQEFGLGDKIIVDDSIATTPEATKAALAAYRGRRIALVAGGHERQQDYSDLAEHLSAAGVKVLACLPVTGGRLAAAARAAAPDIDVVEADDLMSAMLELRERNEAFDTIILSPGAPSYNQFRNFEERGDAFVQIARELFGKGPAGDASDEAATA